MFVLCAMFLAFLGNRIEGPCDNSFGSALLSIGIIALVAGLFLKAKWHSVALFIGLEGVIIFFLTTAVKMTYAIICS